MSNKSWGSAGSVEAAGLVDYYFKFYWKPKPALYSKAYNEVVKNDTYSGIVVEKLECVGHMQKCLDSRLRYLKHTMKGPLADGKKLGDKGCLTDKVINKLQNYFGIAIRQSTGNNIY